MNDIEGILDIKTDDCIGWGGKVDAQGYPRADRRHVHRILFERVHGAIPNGLAITRTCRHWYPQGDKTYKRCVNPMHLKAQSISDVMRENAHVQLGKGITRNRGTDNPSAKLNPDKVRDIRNAAEWGCKTPMELAREYGVNHNTIRNIIKRRTWKHI